MEWMSEYGLFLAKVLTALVAVALVAAVMASFVRRERAMRMYGPFPRVIHLNRRRSWMVAAFERNTLPRREWQRRRKAEKVERRRRLGAAGGRRVFVLDFKGDLHARGVTALRDEVTLILANATDADEVVVRIENAGGVPSGHGLGASQLARIRARNIRLTVAIDRIAASGGYMMACVADRIIAAPFAIVGSIGTYTTIANFNRLLESKGVQVEKFQSGEFKTTVTMLAENTAAGRAKFQEQIEVIHRHFRDFVFEYRPGLDIERVSTGEFWIARDALDLDLVDEIRTSDDYLLEAGLDADLFLVRYATRRGLRHRIGEVAQLALDRASLYLGT